MRIFLVLALTCVSSAAFANVKFCNETAQKLSMAFGYYDSDVDRYFSTGWFEFAPRTCGTPIADRELDFLYWHAELQDGSPVFDTTSVQYVFCIRREVFDIWGRSNCVERGNEAVRFNEVYIDSDSFVVSVR